MTRILIVEDNEELIFIITKPIEVDTLLDLAKKMMVKKFRKAKFNI
jgi:hypothetical protein